MVNTIYNYMLYMSIPNKKEETFVSSLAIILINLFQKSFLNPEVHA